MKLGTSSISLIMRRFTCELRIITLIPILRYLLEEEIVKQDLNKLWGIADFPVELRRRFVAKAVAEGKTVAQVLSPILQKALEEPSNP